MKIVIEANIPYIKGLLEPFGEVVYLPASDIVAEAVRDTDALFVRTRTKCDQALLEGSRVRFIATATIGTDHIDLEYCKKTGIAVYNAPGCNAPAVAQYVFAAIGTFLRSESPVGLTLGVVGVGNVGSIVARWGERIGMRVLRCDPPRMRREGGDFVSMEEIERSADIITFHTPLNREGNDCTFHLADEDFFKRLRRCRLAINSSRGEVVDNRAWLDALNNRVIEAAAIDCWEHEPEISLSLLDKALVATPHIAGYSMEGKTRATAMAVEAFARHFDMEIPGVPKVKAPFAGADIDSLSQVTASYNPLVDTVALKQNPVMFEQLRNTYRLRPEVQ